MAHDLPSSAYKSFPAPVKKKRQYWRWFLPPMFLLSLGLHGLVLFSPTAPSENELVPPPDPEEDGVAITKIDPPKPRPAVAPPANTGTQKTAAPPAPVATPPTRAAAPAQPRSSAIAARRPSPPPRSTPRPRPRSQTTSRNRNRQDTTPVSVPPLPPGQNVNNPNPSAPGVGTAKPAVSPEVNRFAAYLKAFESYGGAVILSPTDAQKFQADWLQTFRDRGPAYANLEITPLRNLNKLPYESNLCLPRMPVPAQALVMVNAEGQVDDDVPLVQTTGYRNFDEAIVKFLKAYDFPDSNAPHAYLAEVEVDYQESGCAWPPQETGLPVDYFDLLKGFVGVEGTSPGDATKAQAEWLATLRADESLEIDDRETFELQPLEGFEQRVEYPLGICLPFEPKTVQWGVLVTPEGKITGEPTLLRSSGYAWFNERAKELVTQVEFPKRDTLTAYVVDVPTGYNRTNCKRADDPSWTANLASSGTPTAASTAAAPAVNREADAATATAAAANSPQATTTTGETATTFNPEVQAQLLQRGRENVLAESVGALNNDPGLLTLLLDSGWPKDVDRACFVATLDEATGPRPIDKAKDAIALSENLDFVPTSLSRFYQVEVSDAGTYCNTPLYEMKVNGVSQLFASAIGFGAGNANTLVIFWPKKPE